MASIIKANQLQDFGGNSIIGSDGAGNLTTQKTLYPAFHVRLSSDFSVANSTVTTIQYSNEVFDTDSAFNTSNYRFTVPSGKAGKYHFYHCVRLGDDTATRLISILVLNGTNHSHFESNNPSSTRPSAGGAVTLDLSVGDYVEHAAFHNTGATDVLLGTAGPDDTFFGAYRIGS
jgi:hypothetical protein